MQRRHFIRGLSSLGIASLTWPALAPTAFSLPTEALFYDGPVPTWVNQLAERSLRPAHAGAR